MIRAEKAMKFLVSCFAFFVLLNFLYERWIDTNEKEAIRNPFTR